MRWPAGIVALLLVAVACTDYDDASTSPDAGGPVIADAGSSSSGSTDATADVNDAGNSDWTNVAYLSSKSDCPSGTTELFRGGTEPSTSCNACTCPSTCKGVQAEVFDGDNCTGTSETFAVGANTCLDHATPPPFRYSVKFTPGTTSCPPSGGDRKAATWGKPSLACKLTGAAPTGFALCRARTGTHDCPTATDQKTVFYTDIDGGATCSPCSCTNDGAACTGSLTWFSKTGCDPTNTYQYEYSALCSHMGGYNPASYKSLVAPATCTASGGVLQGTPSGDPLKAVTVCCPP